MLNVGRAIARSVHTTTGMPPRSLFETVSYGAMTQVFVSMVTTTVAIERAIPVSAVSWAESLADLECHEQKNINRQKMPRLIVAAFFLSIMNFRHDRRLRIALSNNDQGNGCVADGSFRLQ